MYAFCALVALRNRILRFVQRREVVIVGIRLLVELIANDFTSMGHALLMLVEYRRGNMTSFPSSPARAALLRHLVYIIANAKHQITANAKQALMAAEHYRYLPF